MKYYISNEAMAKLRLLNSDLVKLMAGSMEKNTFTQIHYRTLKDIIESITTANEEEQINNKDKK